MSQKKIYILGSAFPFRGGLSAFNERLARQFQDEGHEVKILTFSLQYPKILFPGKTQYSIGDSPKGLKIERCVNSINPFNWLKIGKKIRKKNRICSSSNIGFPLWHRVSGRLHASRNATNTPKLCPSWTI